MLLERAYLQVKAGLEAEFAAMMAGQAVPLLEGTEGTKWVRFGRGVENPGTFMLLIEWAAMEDHVAFTRHPSFADFRALLAPYTTGGSMEHFEMA